MSVNTIITIMIVSTILSLAFGIVIGWILSTIYHQQRGGETKNESV